MAFVGNAELALFEIGIVVAVGLWLPEVVRFISGRRRRYDVIAQNISWAPRHFLYAAIWGIMYLVFMPLAAYRVRLHGNWVSGTNLTQLVLFWVLQALLLATTILFEFNLWAAFVLAVLSLGAAVATTWLFFQLEILAGVFIVIPTVWILFVVIVMLAFAWHTRNEDAKKSFMTAEATWGGTIGAQASGVVVRQGRAPGSQTTGVRARSVGPPPSSATAPVASASNVATSAPQRGAAGKANQQTQTAARSAHKAPLPHGMHAMGALSNV